MRANQWLSYLSFLLIMSLSFFGCSYENNNEQESSVKKNTGEVSLPAAIRAADLPTDATLIAKVYIDYVDSNSTPADTQFLTLPVSENIQFTLTGIPLGEHTFTVIFEYTNDPKYTGTFELARGTSQTVTIGSGSNPGITLDDTAYDISADDDSDGVPNLTELDASVRTDPGDDVCVFGVSKIGHCTFDT